VAYRNPGLPPGRAGKKLTMGDQPWDFFGGNELKLKLQYFGHLM